MEASKPTDDREPAAREPEARPAAETAFTDADAPPAPDAPEHGTGAGEAEDAEHGTGAGEAEDAGEAGAGTEDAEETTPNYLAMAQRVQADFENYRKRMAREQSAAIERGIRKLAEELLPALDHLDVALGSIEDPEVVKGVRLVQGEFIAALKRVGVVPFSPYGETFDPTEHEAMAQQPGDGAEPGTVVQVYQQGYRLNGQLLRPARVVVAS